MLERNFCVYKHTFPDGKVYIGITGQDPTIRWSNGFGYQGQRVFKYIVKYGWDNIKHEILYSDLTVLEAERIERKLITENKAVSVNDKYVLPSKLKGKKPNYVYPPKQTFEIDGVVRTIDEWCELYKISRPCVAHRIKKYGFTPIQALSFPQIPQRGGYNRRPLEYWKKLGLLPEDYSIDKAV